MALLLFNLLQKEIRACFCVNLLILGLVFRIFLPGFVFNLPAVLCFFEFSYQTQVGVVFLLITHFGIFLQIYLLVFTK